MDSVLGSKPVYGSETIDDCEKVLGISTALALAVRGKQADPKHVRKMI